MDLMVNAPRLSGGHLIKRLPGLERHADDWRGANSSARSRQLLKLWRMCVHDRSRPLTPLAGFHGLRVRTRCCRYATPMPRKQSLGKQRNVMRWKGFLTFANDTKLLGEISVRYAVCARFQLCGSSTKRRRPLRRPAAPTRTPLLTLAVVTNAC